MKVTLNLANLGEENLLNKTICAISLPATRVHSLLNIEQHFLVSGDPGFTSCFQKYLNPVCLCEVLQNFQHGVNFSPSM